MKVRVRAKRPKPKPRALAPRILRWLGDLLVDILKAMIPAVLASLVYDWIRS